MVRDKLSSDYSWLLLMAKGSSVEEEADHLAAS